MSDVDKSIADILGTNTISTEKEESKQVQVIENSQINQIENDADYARIQLYDLIERGSESIQDISNIAKESMHPRAFEVLGQLLKTQSDNIDKLLKLQKDKKDLLSNDSDDKNNPSINFEQAVFVGSTADLLKKLKDENL